MVLALQIRFFQARYRRAVAFGEVTLQMGELAAAEVAKGELLL